MLNRVRAALGRLRRALSGQRRPAAGRGPDWGRDPLSHPELRAMSLQELADLPFAPAPSSDPPCGRPDAGAGRWDALRRRDTRAN